MTKVRILANDGLHEDGILLLNEAGYEVITEREEQNNLPNVLPDFDVILVRSATKVRQDLIDACPNLKVIGRGGVGLDNIDVKYAKEKGIEVYNTPSASSKSVAELVFGHLFSLSRSLHLANRQMPAQGESQFKALKKSYSKGVELRGKTLGIIGFGRIGCEVAKIGLGLGMNVMAVDPFIDKSAIQLDFAGMPELHLSIDIHTTSKEKMLEKADYITLHIPKLDEPVIGEKEIEKMKRGVILVNASRGGMIDEDLLMRSLDSGKIGGIGLDVFDGEPIPKVALLNHPKISVSPHIGASTGEAQANIGRELAEKIIHFFEG
jgi:D-3-phosphoglycerate dehydrogenase